MGLIKDIAKHSWQVPVRSFVLPAIFVSFVGVIGTKPSMAQTITPEPVPTGTGTTVTPSGNRFDIGGGQLSGDGKNLFHSFTNFGLQQNQIANFLSQPAIQNILGRVNGGNASVINGIIQVTGGNSNLYLINPAGIIFGGNASLNVPASFTATTANGIGFGSNGWFSASGANNYAALVGTPSSLAFTTGQAGAIVNAANLALQQGQNLTLVGGTVVSTGELSAPGGYIVVAAVPGTSLVRISEPSSPLSLEIQPITPDSSQPNPWANSVLSLAQLLTGPGADSATGLSVNPDGTVQLTGSGIRVENGDVVTEGINTSSTVSSVNGGSILVSAQRNIDTTGGTLNSSYSSTDSSASGSGGAITLTTFNGSIATSDLDSYASAGGSATGGAITLTTENGSVTTGNLSSYANAGNGSATGGANNATFATGGAIALTTVNGNITTAKLDSHASIPLRPGITFARGGAITLATVNGNITTTELDSYGFNPSGSDTNGFGGAIALSTVNGNITTSDLDSSGVAFGGPFGVGLGGEITFTTQNGNITTGDVSAFGTGRAARGGEITFALQNGNVTTGDISSFGGGRTGNGEAITITIVNGNITTGNLNSRGGGLDSPTAGAITLSTQNGNITTGNLDSQITSPSPGQAGAIAVMTQNGNVITGDLISRGGNEGGEIAVTTVNGNIATGNLDSSGGISGAITLTTENGNIATGDINSSAGVNAGAISISAGNNITSGRINSSSFSRNGGAVTLDAGEDIAVSSINAQGGRSTGGNNGGTGGSVNLAAGQFIKISDSFTALDGTTASISTQGGTGGGQITIITGGGLDNPFRVGDATTNGTAKDITSGDFRISSTPVFTVPSPIYTQGNIEIITLP